MPEITDISKHIMLEETKRAWISRSSIRTAARCSRMGRNEPYERTRKLIQKIAPALNALPYALIVGHTSSEPVAAQGRLRAVEFSADRANAVRQILGGKACRPAIFSWWRARPTPILCFRTTPMAPNRRVTITLMREEPPLPPI